MKRLYIKTIILFLVSVSFTASKVEIELLAEHKYSEYRQYAWGFNIRNDLGLMSMNHSYIGAYLFDTSFNVIKHFETQNAAMGGGHGQISPNGKFFSGYEKRKHFDQEIDTLSIYNIETKEETYLTYPNAGDYRWFQDSRRIITYKWGRFDIYDIEKGLIKKGVLNLDDGKPSHISNDFLLLSNDEYLLTSNREGELILYNTSDWTEKEVLATYDSRVDLKISENKQYILVEADQKIDAYSVDNFKRVWSFNATKMKNICAYSLSYNSEFFILVDCDGNVYYADRKRKKLDLLLENKGDSRYSEVEILKGDKEFYLDRNGNTVLHYRINR